MKRRYINHTSDIISQLVNHAYQGGFRFDFTKDSYLLALETMPEWFKNFINGFHKVL